MLAQGTGDVASVNYLYPKPMSDMIPSGSYLINAGSSDRCLKYSGTAFTIEACDASNKDFLFQTLSNDDGSFLIKNVGKEKCMEVTREDETKIGASDCQSSPTQRVNLLPSISKVDQRRIQFSHNSTCLAAKGAVLSIGACTEIPELNFNFVGTQDIL